MGFGKDSRKKIQESFKSWDLVHLVLETWWYILENRRLFQQYIHEAPEKDELPWAYF